MRTQIARRLDVLTARLTPEDVDPRLTWLLWPGPDRVKVLAVVDYCATMAAYFPVYGGPARAPGFASLPRESQELLVQLWALWGSSRRFSRIVAGFVDEERELVQPLWWIRAMVRRASLRRRFPGLLRLFAERGDPLYTSHATYREENWPERETWTLEERDYLSHRFYQWDTGPHVREWDDRVARTGIQGVFRRFTPEELAEGRRRRAEEAAECAIS